MSELIRKYLHHCKEGFSQRQQDVNLSDAVKSDLLIRVPIFENLCEVADFLDKPLYQRQSVRVEWLASLKKRGKEVDVQLATIELYDKIVETLPYLHTLNRNNKIESLIQLCQSELDLIDFGYLSFGKRHVLKEDFEREYNLALSLTKSDEDLHPEAVLKLRELSKTFAELYNIHPA